METSTITWHKLPELPPKHKEVLVRLAHEERPLIAYWLDIGSGPIWCQDHEYCYVSGDACLDTYDLDVVEWAALP